MKAKVLYVVLAVVLALAMTVPALAGPPVGGVPDHNSVSNYAIIAATQTGTTQVTVRVQCHYCTACDPNPGNNPGCTAFTHGYSPPPYGSHTYWCGGVVAGRYAAVQLRDSANNVIGMQKMVLNPGNWPLCSTIQRDIVVNTTVPMTPGTVITVEADIYCGWCGHYYPAPITMTVAALASITVTPGTASLYICNTQAFTATGKDTLGNTVPINPNWSVAPALGTFTPPVGPNTSFHGTTAGNGTITACVGSVCGRATVTVISPNLPPKANAGPDQTVEQAYHQGAKVTLDGSGSTDDGLIQPLTYSWVWPGGNASGVKPEVSLPLGKTTVTLTVFDGEFYDSDTVDITVRDTTPPTIICPPDITAEQTSAAGTPVDLGSPRVTDICDAAPKVTNNAPSVFPLGTTVVTWTAQDFSGNVATCTQKVTVVDTKPPMVSCVESVNPHGQNIPGEDRPPAAPGKNPDGFYQLFADDICDIAPQIFVGTAANPKLFGPFASGIVVKFTEAKGAAPSIKKIGSAQGQAGAVIWHITLPSDPVVSAVDFSGNTSTCTCLVPPPPK